MSPLLALALAVSSSLCWAGLDALRKHLGERMPATALVTAFSVGQVPLFVAWWGVTGGVITSTAYWAPGLAALALNLGANLLFVMAVQRSPLSVTVPFLAFTPVFTAAIGVPLLNQQPNPTELVGIAVVVVGGLVFGLSRDAQRRPLFKEPGVWMMLGVACMWASTTALDKAATDHAPPAFHGLVQTGGVGLVLAVYLSVRRGSKVIESVRPHLPALCLAILFAAAAFGLQLLALRGIDAAHVETQKRVIGLVMALIVGRLMFDEAVTAKKVFGVGVLALGTVIVAIGASSKFGA